MTTNDSGKKNEIMLLGRRTGDELDSLIRDAAAIPVTGERIRFISGHFLGVTYRESTLIGDLENPEVLVVNLEGMDCLTLIEYVEAMRRSGSFAEFKDNLKRVRYLDGTVSYGKRRHFFTDWCQDNSEFIEDITPAVGGHCIVPISKKLNLKRDGTHIIPGIGSIMREIIYIPVHVLDDSMLDLLKTGDYAGIYSPRMPEDSRGTKNHGILDDDGLDVTHVGIIIKTPQGIFLRHASSSPKNRKVVDEDFRSYIADKKGLLVLRAVLRS